jgi:hypothetical protein
MYDSRVSLGQYGKCRVLHVVTRGFFGQRLVKRPSWGYALHSIRDLATSQESSRERLTDHS